MPNGWVHATIDLIAFGCPYLHLHQEKDKPHQHLGPKHRNVNHEWYQAFGQVWTHDDPFPIWLCNAIRKVGLDEGADFAEEQMVGIAHEYYDRIWDSLTFPDRKYWESVFAWILINPSILRNWAGVDVERSLIQRTINDAEIWEYCPKTRIGYRQLYRYVQTVVRNDPSLQNMLKQYG